MTRLLDAPRKPAPLYVSYARQDCIALSVILLVILYIRQPLFLKNLLAGEVLAMPSKTGCPFALTLHTRPEKIFHSMLT